MMECHAVDRGWLPHYKKNIRLGLSFDQIVGLECLGLDVSRFLPRADVSFKENPRIPPSFRVDGARVIGVNLLSTRPMEWRLF